jgi:hypothetical protein
MSVAEAFGSWRAGLRALRRVAGRVAAGMTPLFAVWLTLTIHPQPLFAFSIREGNVVLHARAPLPKEAGPILRDALSRVAQSPLYDPSRERHAFLCDSQGLYTLLALTTHGSGKTNPFRNVFIRPANVARDRIIERSGLEKPSPRTLAYVLAHELTHALTYERLGFRTSRALSAMQSEGYADFVALGPYPDVHAGREALRGDAFEMNVSRSGRYERYRLLVSYLLGTRRMSPAQLFARRLEEKDVLTQFLADRSL